MLSIFGRVFAYAAIAIFPLAAAAHEAPTGWTYDYSCCSSYDCRQIVSAWVEVTKEGYLAGPKKELIPFGDKRIKQSKDEFYHLCTVSGRDDTAVLCLYVPLNAF